MRNETMKRADNLQQRAGAVAAGRPLGSAILAGAVLLLFAWPAAYAQDASVNACTVLKAARTAHSAATDRSAPDTARLQRALDLCDPGKAVVLEADGANDAFVSAPLRLSRGVTLFLDHGVTLFASRNPRDYDLRPQSCGFAHAKQPGCKPFLYAYQAAFSGVAGDGTIDGQGDKPMTASRSSWWKIREQAQAPAHQGNAQGSVPDLVASYESQGFSIRGVHLKNASGDSVAIYKTIGLQAQDIAIDSAQGGDGVLLSNSPGAKLTGLDIHVAGAAVDARASILGGTSSVEVSGLHAVGGQGIHLGDPAYGGVHGVRVHDSVLQDTGLSFDLRGMKGGSLHDIQFSNLCLEDAGTPLLVTSDTGSAHALPSGRDVAFSDVVVRNKGILQPDGLQFSQTAACPTLPAAPAPMAWSVDLKTVRHPGRRAKLVVAQDGSGDFRTIQEAIDALPDTGGDITVRPGTWREVVTLRKPHVRLHGVDPDPRNTVIVFNHTGPRDGGTFNSATVFVESSNDSIENLSIVNDAGIGKGQAVALAVTGDRATFRHLRILGAQDTLFAASRYCYGDYGPCVPARQYFSDCYIAGNVDFIFGDGTTVFDRCELHGIRGRVMYTAQSRHTAEQKSAYVLDHCRMTADPQSQSITLGRPWRPYATVVYLHAQLDAPVIPAGWTEWPRLGVPSLPLAFYAEYDSTGPGADPSAREQDSHQLTAAQAAAWAPRKILSGEDGWDPIQKHRSVAERYR
jgi:polygalacturonase